MEHKALSALIIRIAGLLVLVYSIGISLLIGSRGFVNLLARIRRQAP